MLVKTIEDKFEDYFDEIFNFCKIAIKELKEENKSNYNQTLYNMAIDNWRNTPSCLLYRIYIKKDFSNNNGMLTLVYDNKELIGLSGVMKYTKDISTMGKRTYVLKKNRNRILFHNYMLSEQIRWSVFSGVKVCLMLFNESHKAIYDSVKKCNSKSYILPCNKYRDFIILEGLYKIYSTMQYVVAFIIDDEFKIENIKWEG